MIKYLKISGDIAFKLWIFIYAFSMIILPIMKYGSLKTTYYDLGLYGNKLYNYSIGYDYIDAHAHIFYKLAFLFYKIFFNSMVGLLVFQSVIILFASYLLFRFYGKVVFYVFSILPPIWFLNLSDFHFEFLLFPLLIIFFRCVELGKFKFAVFYAFLISLIKEPYALTSFFCGVYIFVYVRNQKENSFHLFSKYRIYILSAILCIFSILYFNYAIKGTFTSHRLNDLMLIDNAAFSWLGVGIFQKIIFICNNPIEIFREIFGDINKLYLLGYASLCFGLIFLFRPLPLIVALPSFSIQLLSQLPEHTRIASHYFAGSIIPLLFSFIYSYRYFISNARGMISISAICIITVFSILFSPAPYSYIFWSNKYTSYNWTAYSSPLRIIDFDNFLKNNIPPENYIGMSIQNNIITDKIVNRKILYPFPYGISYSSDDFNDLYIINRELVEYVLINNTPPLFFDDKSCVVRHGQCTDDRIVNIYNEHIAKINANYYLVAKFENYSLYRLK